MPELTLNTILLIVIGLVVVLGVLIMFWGTISKFFPWVKGPVINPAVINVVRAQCVLLCTQEKDAIVAKTLKWQVNYDVNGDGTSETVCCADGLLSPAITSGEATISNIAEWNYDCAGIKTCE